MGGIIVHTSPVGALEREGSKYSGPPTEEDLEIAKRAAENTRKTWEERKQKELEKKKAKYAKKRASQIRKKSAHKHEQAKSGVTSADAKTGATPSIQHDPRSAAAQKLGISESQLARRLAALQKYKSEESS